VTGGSGFLGGPVVAQLSSHDVADVAAPRSSQYDLRDHDAVRAVLADTRPDVVIHLAAVVGGIGANMDSPGAFFHDNAIMGIQLIEESRLAGVERFVCLGTVCAYPKHAPAPFREDDLWNGYPEETNAPYGLAKKMLLVQLQAYAEEYGFPGVYLLPVNLYGPGDNFDLETGHVIPAMIRKFVEARERGSAEVVLWGDGSPTREFLYVEDAAEGILAAAKGLSETGPVNLGSSEEIGMRDLAEQIRRIVGYEGRVLWDTTKPNGQPRRKLDVTRAERLFGWRSRTRFEDGLRRTIEAFRAARAR
ncbi:MAG: GDP-L-fucose synthase family protein, partial [Thermoanaerobaculia bacterium]